MSHPLINAADPPERQREKLLTIADVLMRRVEQVTDDAGAAYLQFERAAMLEDQVRERTRDLETTLAQLNQAHARLADANRATEAARANLANAIETVQEGFALFGADEMLVMCNSRFGMHLRDIYRQLRPGLRFADYVGLVSRSRFLRLPEGVRPEDWAARRMRRHGDSRAIFNVELTRDQWLQVSEHRTPDGGTVVLQTDVTDIIRSERLERGKLLDKQARMVRATLDHISQGVVIFDNAARLVGWNERAGELLTIPRGRLRLGLEFEDLLPRMQGNLRLSHGLSPAELRDWVHAPGPRAALRFELRRGEALILDGFAQQMPDQGFVMSFTDVTSERAAISALSRANETLEARVAARTLELEGALANAERANAARTRFVAAASHDLLQPLSAAKLFIASIADEALGPSARDTLHKARTSLESVESILDALLDISKLESGRMSLSPGPVALRPVLQRLATEFAPIAAEKQLRLRIVGDAPSVVSDPTYLRRILQNLIGNALRYTDRGGVLVGVRRAGPDAVRIDVIDTGPGIPAEDHENIFREFHRLNARASASEGLGLGLAIVERAAALLGHRLTLESRVGRGTRFSLRLDLADRPAEQPQSASSEPRQARSLDGLIGLLVDNDSDIRRALGLLLESWGIAVLEAANAPEALSLLEELGIAPDFMLIDNQLGGDMNGLELIGVLRARYGQIPVRLITADRTDDVREDCASASVSVIYKPLDTRALERFVTSLA